MGDRRIGLLILLVVSVIVGVLVRSYLKKRKEEEATPPDPDLSLDFKPQSDGSKIAQKEDGSTVVIAADNTKTVTSPDKTKTVTKPDGSKETTTPDGKTTSTSAAIADSLKKMATGPDLYISLAGGMVVDTIVSKALTKFSTKFLEKGTERFGSKMLTRAAQEAGESVFEKLGTRLVKKLGQKAAQKAAAKAGAKVATNLTTKAATAAATGPGAPFVAAGELIFGATLGYMDTLNLGGFKDAKTSDELAGEKKEFDKTFNDFAAKQKLELPILYGPLDDLSAEGPEDYVDAITAECQAILAVDGNEFIKKVLDKIKTLSDSEKQAMLNDEEKKATFMSENLEMDKVIDKALDNMCAKAGGVLKTPKSKKYCTFTPADKAKCNAPLSEKKLIYSEWNEKDKQCEIRPGMMRNICEGMQHGVTYNVDTGTCNLTDEYCLQKTGTRDCKIGKAQDIAETIFGRAFVRGIMNVFDIEHMYHPCPKGTINPTEWLANQVSETADAVLSKTPQQMLAKEAGININIKSAVEGLGKMNITCFGVSCNDDEDKDGGLCYPKCKPGYTGRVGLCIKDCPPGWERTGGPLGLTCARKCPDGFPPVSAIDQVSCKIPTRDRDIKPATVDKCDVGVPAKCPDGWNTTVEGPGGMCQQPCPAGQKNIGGVCYSQEVNLLTKLATSSCPNGGTNIGAICSKPAKCDGGWDEQRWGCCWIDCSTTKSWNAAKNCHRDESYGSTYSCPAGYDKLALSCNAKNFGPAPVAKSILAVGVCPPGKLKDGGMCYNACEAGWTKTVGGCCTKQQKCPDDRVEDSLGLCYLKCTADEHKTTVNFCAKNVPEGFKDAGLMMTRPTETSDSYPRLPNGPALKMTLRKRIAPVPGTSVNDIATSTIGRRANELSKAVKGGNIAEMGAAAAMLSLASNPVMNAFGAAELVDLFPSASDVAKEIQEMPEKSKKLLTDAPAYIQKAWI
jgi:hypothetical protein